jgi:hypothetical protein
VSRSHSTVLLAGALFVLPAAMLGTIYAIGPYGVGDNPGNHDGLKVFVWFASTIVGAVIGYLLVIVAGHRLRSGLRRVIATAAALVLALAIFLLGLIPWVNHLTG